MEKTFTSDTAYSPMMQGDSHRPCDSVYPGRHESHSSGPLPIIQNIYFHYSDTFGIMFKAC